MEISGSAQDVLQKLTDHFSERLDKVEAKQMAQSVVLQCLIEAMSTQIERNRPVATACLG